MENSARNNRQSSSRREGEITIDYGDNRKKNLDKDSGEYVDFEEVN